MINQRQLFPTGGKRDVRFALFKKATESLSFMVFFMKQSIFIFLFLFCIIHILSFCKLRFSNLWPNLHVQYYKKTKIKIKIKIKVPTNRKIRNHISIAKLYMSLCRTNHKTYNINKIFILKMNSDTMNWNNFLS